MYRCKFGGKVMFKTSIRNKLIILLLLTTILPFGTSIIITYIHTKDSFTNRVVQENSNLLYQGKVNLENYINELNRLTLSLYNNNDFMNFMRSANNTNNYLNIGIIKQVMQTILYAEDHIDRVHISFAKDNRVISASKQSTVVFATKDSAMNNENFVKAKENPYSMYIEPIKTKPWTSKQSDKNVLTIHRSFANIPSSEVLAFISLEVRPDKIFELSENLYDRRTEDFYILSTEGDLIYSSNKDILKDENKPQWIDRILQSEEETGTIEWKEASFNGVMIYDRMTQSAGGMFLVKRIPFTILHESAFNVAKINIMFGVIGLLLVIMATLFVSLKITSPIRILLQNIQKVEEGNMNVQFQSFSKDEIGILGMRFKQMIEKINQLINREYKLELENKTNQLKLLQSQINPHFLYNALQSIGTVALKNKVPQIYQLITHLSNNMRYVMNTDEDIVPLAKEINYTKAYLLLQKERFGEQLEYGMDIDEEILHIHVPKMILQPIIENYFKHGFEKRNGVGKIKVECRKEGEYLRITVLDNGDGVSESRLEEIYQHFAEGKGIKNGEETNIGLKNVYVRLMLYYNGLATLQLSNQEGAGLLVTMRLPISMEGGKDEGNYSR